MCLRLPIIQPLAARNMALRRHTEILHAPCIKWELFERSRARGKIWAAMKDHIHRVERSLAGHTSYLGKHIHNESIDSMSTKIIHSMVTKMKQSKYFAIILEHMSVIIRFVSLEDMPRVKKHFMGFLEVEEITDKSFVFLNFQEVRPPERPL